MRQPQFLVTAFWDGEGVKMYDGRKLSVYSANIRKIFTDTLVMTPDVIPLLLSVAERPLTSWRYWHRRFTLIRAHKAHKSVIRDWSGLIDPDDSDSQGLVNAWIDTAEIQQWCKRSNLPLRVSAGAIGIDLLNSEEFSPGFTPMWSRVQAEETLRASLYGGRAEVFWDRLHPSDHKYSGPVVMYDMNGAYLDVMRSLLLPYPYRFLISANWRVEGITEVTIEESAKYPILPVRYKGFPNGCKRGIWTNLEIRRAIDYGAKLICVHGGVHFSTRTKALQPLANHLVELRESEPHGALRQLFKKIPNALIGRFAAPPSVCVTKSITDPWRSHPKLVSAIRVGDSAMSVELRVNRCTPWYAVGWSAYILAEQRLRLHSMIDELDRHGYDVLYCDTDSVMFGLNGLLAPPCSSAIGSYKREWLAHAVHIRGIKNYRTVTVDGESVSKHAGKKRNGYIRQVGSASELAKLANTG